MQGFRIADWGGDTSELENAAGGLLYKTCELSWERPTVWGKEDAGPRFATEEPFLYALVRNHGNSVRKDRIEYIGLTSAPKTRFGSHRTAKEIVKKRGSVKFTYAPINFIKGRNKIDRIGRAMEEIEHLLIWAVFENLENTRKLYTLPGMGVHSGNAWHIKNTGYRFSGQMPREIVFPWMLIRPGRDRSLRS